MKIIQINDHELKRDFLRTMVRNKLPLSDILSLTFNATSDLQHLVNMTCYLCGMCKFENKKAVIDMYENLSEEYIEAMSKVDKSITKNLYIIKRI